MRRTLLALFAHPDDESFATGGTLARYARAGVRVVLGCATRGEAGIVHEEGMPQPEDMGRVREEELRCACRVLGVEELRFLGYRDSGMAGAPDNDHPLALIRADPEEVVSRLLVLFGEFHPEVVITFGPDGGYGHPDHVAIHNFVRLAWERASETGHPPRKLYFLARPRSALRRLRQKMWELGLIDRPPDEEEIERFGLPDDQVTTRLDIRPYLEIKRQALRCHRTQLPPKSPWLRLPPEEMAELWGDEWFTLAATRGVPFQAFEDDLFAGLE
ncbi:MAG: PIG-L family deacetylase [Chloroflexia bacterium]